MFVHITIPDKNRFWFDILFLAYSSTFPILNAMPNNKDFQFHNNTKIFFRFHNAKYFSRILLPHLLACSGVGTYHIAQECVARKYAIYKRCTANVDRIILGVGIYGLAGLAAQTLVC
jgi:hypothetical protein